jgi:hypothetical protein
VSVCSHVCRVCTLPACSLELTRGTVQVMQSKKFVPSDPRDARPLAPPRVADEDRDWKARAPPPAAGGERDGGDRFQAREPEPDRSDWKKKELAPPGEGRTMGGGGGGAGGDRPRLKLAARTVPVDVASGDATVKVCVCELSFGGNSNASA